MPQFNKQLLGQVTVDVPGWSVDPPSYAHERKNEAQWNEVAELAEGYAEAGKRAARHSSIGWEKAILADFARKWANAAKYARKQAAKAHRLNAQG